MQSAVDAIIQAAIPKLPQFRSQEVNNLAWSLARLVDASDSSNPHNTGEILKAIGLQLCDRKRPVKSQDIGTSLWSLSTLEFADADIYRGIVSRFNTRMAERAKPQVRGGDSFSRRWCWIRSIFASMEPTQRQR